MAATVELTGSAPAALQLTEHLASRLQLGSARPWHTTRAIITRAGDALVSCCDAWGHLAGDVATLHTASAGSVGERADGAWHAEWSTLATLARRTLTAAAQARELLSGLRFEAARAAENLTRAEGVLAEQLRASESVGPH